MPWLLLAEERRVRLSERFVTPFGYVTTTMTRLGSGPRSESSVVLIGWLMQPEALG